MSIPKGTKLAEVPAMLAANIARYNAIEGAAYNPPYTDYIATRNAGIAAAGSLSAWLAGNGAAPIQKLLISLGMDARLSDLVPCARFQGILSGLPSAVVNWVAGLTLPLEVPPPRLVNAATGHTLSAEIQLLYDSFAKRNSVTDSGGYVAASKTMHCLFPELAPIVDGQHTGISYYNIERATYVPPLGIDRWEKWVGEPLGTVVNPSPRGAGRNGWRWQQFLAAMGVNQHIYELWQVANGNPGAQAFLAVDPTPGTSGIPRIIDKGLW